MPQGAYWYHSHLHALTTAQVYTGLAGLLAIGRTDGNIPLVTDNRIPVRNMVLQYNYVFDRKGGLAQLNNANWPQFVSTLEPPKGGELADGTYRPLLTPINFSQSKAGTAVLHGLVRGAAFDPQQSRAVPVHPEQPAALHRASGRPTRTCRPIPRSPTICATCSSRSTASSSR